MTVNSSIASARYSGDGISTAFPIPFYFLDDSQISVSSTVKSTGVTTELVLGTDYSVTGEGVQTGGTLNLTNALASGSTIYISRDMPLDQQTDYTPNDKFPAEVTERALDKLTMIAQQLSAERALGVRYPVYEDIDGELPQAAARAKTVLGWAEDGSPTYLPIPSSFGAGDLRDEIGSDGVIGFAAGVDFTAGVSTSLTLSRSAGTKGNVSVYFDAAYQGGDQILSLIGPVLTFASPIPLGVQRVYVRTGTTLSVYIPPVGSLIDNMLAPGSKVASRANDFISLTDWGCVNDGTAQTARIQSAITAIGSKKVSLIVADTFVFSGDLTFGANTELDFRQGGMLVGISGTETVQVQRPIMAGPRQIFSNCVVRATVGMLCGPEWFGAARDNATSDTAAFKACNELLKNVGGIVHMQPGDYALGAPIDNFYSHIAFRGAGQNITRLKVLLTTIDGIDCIGTPAAPINNPVFECFNLSCAAPSPTGTGINLQYTTLAKLTDIQISDFIGGIYMLRATNSFFTRVGTSYSGATNGFNGWVIDGGGTGAGGNASSVWRDCYADASASSGTGKIAFRAYGKYVSDLYFSNSSSASCDYGYAFDYSTATAGGYADVIIHNPVVDVYTQQAISVNAMPRLQKLKIIGGWLCPKGTLAETDGVYVSGSAGMVTVIGAQFDAENNPANAIGVRVINSVQARVSGCDFTNHHYAIRETGSALCVYSDNSFYCEAGAAAAAHISIIGSTRSQVTGGNSFGGYATNTVVVDNTSVGVGVTCNTLDAATLAAPRVVNNSSGPIGGADGSTGLNSGV